MALLHVLLVDDRPREADALMELLSGRIDLSVRHPGNMRDRDLVDLEVVLVDWQLDEWQQLEEQPNPSLRPSNGVALAQTLRS